MRSKIQKPFGRFIVAILILNSFVGIAPMYKVVQAQDRVIIVNAEQPNVWTLEQAHYLLAQMHRRNLDLKAKSLEDLDPNEIAGLRFDVMRMLVEFGATFNQADLATNRLLSRNQEFNTGRREELIAERARLRKESIRLTGEIEELETEKADTDDEAEQKRLDAKIAAKTNRRAKVDKEVEFIDGELETLTTPSGELKPTEGGAKFDPNSLPKSVFDKAFEEAAAKQIGKFNEAPKLNASLRLDNFLQMQYEIISKQLTLLRDELGPGERLVFLELPQTVNVAHHEANKKWAQSWWKIAGYTKRERLAGSEEPVPSPTPKVVDNQRPITVTDDFNSILKNTPIKLPIQPTPPPCVPASPATFTNANAITISDSPKPPTPSAPYPSSINVSAVGRATKVTVTLNNLSHSYPDQVDMLLVGPQGQNALIWSDVGGANPVSGLTITLDDAAGSPLPSAGALANGTFQPTNDGAVEDKFPAPAPAPAPAPLSGSALSVFNGADPNGTWSLYIVDERGGIAGTVSGGWSLSITTDCVPLRPAPTQVTYEDKFVNLDTEGPSAGSVLSNYLTDTRIKFSNRQVRTIDLIPRQSSLNVNDMKLSTRAGAFNFVLSTLFGFGSQLNVQRQREQFSQFVQQELYSSAFGKGAREFGWTFTPMPGTDRLQSGVRTTYAAVVVPEEATSLVLESNGCYFPRSEYQPLNFGDTKDTNRWGNRRTSRGCGTETKAFIVPIPSANINGTNDFWVESVSYQAVGKGDRIVVLISGKNFSPQIGALVNGIPLVHSIGLAQPLIRDDSTAGKLTAEEFKEAEISGKVERIDPNKVVLSFKMPKDFEGTPAITLIAPGRAVDINWLAELSINGKKPAKLAKPDNPCGAMPTPGCVYAAEPMFTGDPVRPLRIDSVEVFRSPGRRVNVLITGAGFRNTHRVFVNGVERPAFISSTLLHARDIDAPADDKIQVILATDEKTIKSTAVVNPTQLKIDKVTVVSYEAANGRKPGVLIVRIEGMGFNDELRVSPGKIRVNVTSRNEAYLTIPNPNETEVVTLRDPVTNVSVSTVVGRKPPD